MEATQLVAHGNRVPLGLHLLAIVGRVNGMIDVRLRRQLAVVVAIAFMSVK